MHHRRTIAAGLLAIGGAEPLIVSVRGLSMSYAAGDVAAPPANEGGLTAKLRR